MQGGIFAVPAWSGSLSEAEERDAELDEATLGRMKLEEQELMEEILQDERNAAFLQEAMKCGFRSSSITGVMSIMKL